MLTALVLLGSAVVAAVGIVTFRFLAHLVNRAALRAVRRHGGRLDRFKLTSKQYITASLLADEQVAEAVAQHADASGLAEDDVWELVEKYVDEIVPHFNPLAYYRFGYGVSRVLLNLVYRVEVAFERPHAFDDL